MRIWRIVKVGLLLLAAWMALDAWLSGRCHWAEHIVILGLVWIVLCGEFDEWKREKQGPR